MTTLLTLFDLADLTPTKAPASLCRRCQQQPATTRVYTARNLYGICPPHLYDAWFCDVAYRADSGPCCTNCAQSTASSWWIPSRSCPAHGCRLWAHTLTNPHPEWDCQRHHNERAVVWQEPVGGAA